jgi:hypothetical protein
MGGGGTIIVRNAIKNTLTQPVVHGSLPSHLLTEVDPVLAKDVNDWAPTEHAIAVRVFHWAATHS